VTAQQGAGVEAVLEAAQGAITSIGPRPVLELVEGDTPGGPAATAVEGEVVTTVPAPAPAAEPARDAVIARVTVRNPLGLHARPAALVARTVASLGVPVTVEGVDATSVLQLMALGATGGREIEVRAHGDGAEGAVATVVGLIEGGFGEA
jgi:PTS hybrid protein